LTKINRQLVAGFGDLLLLGFAVAFAVDNGVINQCLNGPARLLSVAARVGGRIFGLIVANGLNIAAVGYHGGELFDAV
jgi:hypothetical protein